MQFPGCEPFAMWATSCNEFPFESTSNCNIKYSTIQINSNNSIWEKQLMQITWALRRSSLKRSKTWKWLYGSQEVETALRISPLGWPGSVTFLVVIRTVSSGESERAVHDCPQQVLMFIQNVFIILCAKFIKLFRASGDGITAQINKIIHVQIENYLYIKARTSIF